MRRPSTPILPALTVIAASLWAARATPASPPELPADEAARLRALLTDGYRRLYLALPPTPMESRVRLLVEMLGSDERSLRELALEIVAREAAEGAPAEPRVAAAVLALLDSPDRGARERAAFLAGQYGSGAVAPALERALTAEREPTVAAALLRGLTRWPTETARDVALSWLSGFETAAHAPAADLLAAAADAGLLADDAARTRAAEAIRRCDPLTLGPAPLALLSRIGTDQDRARLATLLDDPRTRLAAAQALSSRPEMRSRVLDAAAQDAALFSAAVDAVLAGSPSLDDYRALTALPARSEPERQAGLSRVAGALPPRDVLALALEPTRTPPDREALLAPLCQLGPTRRTPMAADPEGLSRAILMLAEVRLGVGQALGALAALDCVPDAAPPTEAARATFLRLRALLSLNQIPAALGIDAAAELWIEAVRLDPAAPNALEIIQVIRQRFGVTLTPEQSRTLDQLALRLAPPQDR